MLLTRYRTLPVFAISLLALGLCRPAQAQGTLLFTLENPNPSVAPGDLFQFIATVQNSDTVSSLFLLGGGANIDAGSPGDIANDYFSELPPTLSPNDGTANPNPPNSYAGRLFDVQVAPTATEGQTVTGSYSIDYQVGNGATQTAFQNFVITVHVSAVPEPALPVSFGLLLGGSLLLRRRQQRQE